jgi:hypothetical protein
MSADEVMEEENGNGQIMTRAERKKEYYSRVQQL